MISLVRTSFVTTGRALVGSLTGLLFALKFAGEGSLDATPFFLRPPDGGEVSVPLADTKGKFKCGTIVILLRVVRSSARPAAAVAASSSARAAGATKPAMTRTSLNKK